jgi:oxygen-independent coproporphyrinogen-3 oxidase
MQHSAAPQTPNFYWLGLEAPRYTSYPTSPHFTGQIDRATHQKWLGELQSNASVSVYIHIPFCNEMCWFCGCHTKVTKRYEPIKKYVTNLLQEIATIKKHTGSNGILQNIHFGGGSPSLLEPNDLNAILTAIKTAFKTVGRRVLVDEREFFRIVDEHNQGGK